MSTRMYLVQVSCGKPITSYETRIIIMTDAEKTAFQQSAGATFLKSAPHTGVTIDDLNVALRWGRDLGPLEAEADGGQ